MVKLKKSEYPAALRGYSEVKAIHVGGCPYEEGKWNAEANAHTHVWIGEICFGSKRYLNRKTTQLHELAHLLVPPSTGHRDPWRKMFHSLAGPLAEKALVYYPKVKRTRDF